MNERWEIRFADMDGYLALTHGRREGEWVEVEQLPLYVREFFLLDERGAIDCGQSIKTHHDLRPHVLEMAGLEAAVEVPVREYRVLREVDEEITIDLKWSLWSQSEGVWEDYAEGVWEQIERAVNAGKLVKVSTAPKKEIHYGTVLVWKEGDTYRATVDFEAHWDEIPQLLAGNEWYDNLSDEMQESEREALWEYFVNDNRLDENGEPIGAKVEGQVEARTFEVLMLLIDELDNKLWRNEKANSEALDEWFEQSRPCGRCGEIPDACLCEKGE